MTTLISIASSTSQLSDFCAFMIPSIWAGTNDLFHPKRHTAFKNYVYKVLKATQISCACIIVALYYIHRLRVAYPSIQASIGSEVRLFTTALLLANKYLDDNTFTNKTWSEVSSIPVKELNIMEMEFLNALNYNIHVPYQVYLNWAEQCQLKYTQSSVKRKYHLIEKNTTSNNKKRHYYHDYSTMYYTTAAPPICKPILSWSSSSINNQSYYHDTNIFYF